MLPFSDGRGWRPDTYSELAFVVFAVLGVGLTLVFTGLDAQIEYAATATSTYFSFTSDVPEDAVVFNQESVDLMNTVSERSLGADAVAAERLYCGEINNQNVFNFRLADTIEDSDIGSVSGSCVAPVDIWVHSQPDGSDELSQEDKDLESTGASYTCIQYESITSSPLNNRLNGINCWQINGNGESFSQVPVILG